MYDVVVVGARCAGASTALLFARAGYRVLLLDRMRFPSDTVSTHHIQRPGLELLERWGVLEGLLATGCPPSRRLVYIVRPDVRLAGPVPATQGIAAAYAPRRHVLDELLVRAAVDAGADFQDRCTVTGVVSESGRCVGVRYRGSGAGSGVVRARLVVGADGMRSSVARFVGAVTEHAEPELTCCYYTYWADVPADFELYERPGRLVGAVETHDDLTLIAGYFRQGEFARIRRDPYASYLENIVSTAPELAERIAGRRPVERLRGSGSQLNFFRQACGPGWVLVGDAGHSKDSITGTGITDALRQADLLVASVGNRLHDDQALTSALQDFGASRREFLEPSYRLAQESARLEVTAERLGHLRWVQSDPAATAMFIAIAVGAAAPPRPPTDVFAGSASGQSE